MQNLNQYHNPQEMLWRLMNLNLRHSFVVVRVHSPPKIILKKDFYRYMKNLLHLKYLWHIASIALLQFVHLHMEYLLSLNLKQEIIDNIYSMQSSMIRFELKYFERRICLFFLLKLFLLIDL